MATRAVSVWKRSVVSHAAMILGVWVALAISGCAHRSYRATELPMEFAAPATESVDTALISRLARYAGRSEVIGPGDLLEVTIDAGYGDQPARATPVWVAQDGTADLPLIGTVALAGLRLQDAGRVIASAGVERGVYVPPYPYVAVEMKEQKTNQVTVIGAVEDPGVKELPRNSSYLLTALVAAGNLSENAGPEIEIRRGIRPDGGPDLPFPRQLLTADGSQTELASYGEPGLQAPRTIRVNLISATQDDPQGYYLEDGDLVAVSEREPRSIRVMGLVKDPGEYDLPADRDLRFLDALAMAGDRTSQLADKAWIIRQLPGQADPVRVHVSVREAKRNGAANARLAAGDVVSVEETPITFLVDMLRSFVRFGLSSSIPLF